jgi:hypothetical protein
MKNNTLLYYTILLLLCLSSITCTEVFEPDISNDIVEIVIPADSTITTISNQTFWWNEVEDAFGYHLQIVKPDFNNIQQLVLDSNLTGTQFEYSLSPGTYQWRVKAFNDNYSTAYTTYTITIDSTSNLSGLQVVLKTPGNGIATNDSVLYFEWYPLYNATDYRFELKDNSGSPVINPQIIQDAFIEIPSVNVPVNISDGTYTWSVQASNSISSTSTTTRTLMVDKIPPNFPVLLYPADNATLTDTLITFSWDRGAISGTQQYDSLVIKSDTTISASVIAKKLTNPSYSDSTGTGTFFWRVKSFDEAGNTTSFTKYRVLNIQ